MWKNGQIKRKRNKKSWLNRVDKCSRIEVNSLSAKDKHTKQYTVLSGLARIYGHGDV